jgi:hypothetical protein
MEDSSPRRNYLKILLTLLAASIVPASFTAATFGGSGIHLNIWLAAFVVSFGHAIIFGVPIFSFLYWRDLNSWWACLLAGLVIGCLPTTVLLVGTTMLDQHSYAVHIRDGMQVYELLTTDEKIEKIKTLSPMLVEAAFLGMIGALAAWAMWKILPDRVDREDV